jgi:hypothetical protein
VNFIYLAHRPGQGQIPVDMVVNLRCSVREEFLDQLIDCRLLKKGPAAWSWLGFENFSHNIAYNYIGYICIVYYI